MFKDILHKMAAHLDGALGCLLLDGDAIPVAELYPEDGASNELVSTMAVEVTTFLGSLRKRGVMDEAGSLDELLVSTDRMTTICRLITDEYVLLVALAPGVDVGRGRAMLRLMAPWVEKEL